MENEAGESKIIYTEWGLGCVLDDVIELNENLVVYPEVKKKVLQHELEHKTGKYTRDDLIHDNDTPLDLEVLKFMLKYPKTLIQLLPVYRVRRIWRVNWYAIMGYLVVVVVWGFLLLTMSERGLI